MILLLSLLMLVIPSLEPGPAAGVPKAREESTGMCSAEYSLYFTVPPGWSWQERAEELTKTGAESHEISFGCYLPVRAGFYKNFKKRIAEEVAAHRVVSRTVHVRNWTIGGLEAATITRSDPIDPNSMYLETYIGVPEPDLGPHAGRLFAIITESGPSDRHQIASTYDELLKSFRVVREDV